MEETLFPLPDEEKIEKKQGKGKARLEKGERYQVKMEIASLDDLLPADHRARLVWAMVEIMDMSRFYEKIKSIEGEAGRPAIDPQAMIAVWLYATLEGVGSAREVERQCKENIAYRWLMGDIKVNYHTLADSRVKYEEELDDLLIKGVTALMQEGIVKLERTAQDGMRVRANAGGKSFKRKDKLEKYLQQAQEHVKQLKEQNEEGDQNRRRRAAQERAARERVERLQKAIKEIDKIEEKRKKSHKKKGEEKEPRSSSTDPEVRFMQMASNENRPAYNAQLAIDTESRIIVGVGISNENDATQLKDMLERIQTDHQRYPREHLVDGGFVSHAQIEYAHQKQVQIYAPLPKPRRKGQDSTKPRKTDGDGVREWRERMVTDTAKSIYKIRAATIEWANALARNRGFRMMNVRGVRKVRSVLLWYALAHNLIQTNNLLMASSNG